MSDCILPTPDGGCSLPINLDLVEKLEKKAGSLFKLADQLVQRELTLSEILQVLEVVYGAAGILVPDVASFLLRQSTRPPAQILSEVLVHILTPAARMGAVETGERDAAG
jgi:hypothetical protein